MLPEDRRYVDDNYYRRGQTNVWFHLESLDTNELDVPSARRAVRELLLALRAEKDLKVSAFADIVMTDEDEIAEVEFVVFNKLGVTSLSKLRRFMDEHLVSEHQPRIVLVDPETDHKFRATDFTIQYLFHDFVAGARRNDWLALRDYLQTGDRGYAALVHALDERTAKMHALTPDDALKAANHIGINWVEVDFDPEDLAKGMKVELEHGSKVDERVNITDDDLNMTAQIAWAHLMEDPDYYIHLEAMEQGFDAEQAPELAEGLDKVRTPELRKEAMRRQTVATKMYTIIYTANEDHARYATDVINSYLADAATYNATDAWNRYFSVVVQRLPKEYVIRILKENGVVLRSSGKSSLEIARIPSGTFKRFPGTKFNITPEEAEELQTALKTVISLQRDLRQAKKLVKTLCLTQVEHHGFVGTIDDLENLILRLDNIYSVIKKESIWTTGKEVQQIVLEELDKEGVTLGKVREVTEQANEVKKIFRVLDTHMGERHYLPKEVDDRYLEYRTSSAICTNDPEALDILHDLMNAVNDLILEIVR